MLNKKKPEKIGLFIPAGTHQSGNISIEGAIRIDGSFSGSAYCESSLRIGITGTFTGEADVAQADISGSFKGNLMVRERFSLSKTGQFSGLLDAELASMEVGSSFEGEVRIKGRQP